MTDATETRKTFARTLEALGIVEGVDTYRDGCRTLLVHLAGDPDTGFTELEECTNCGAVGLPERIKNHDCQDFLEWRAER